jgi:glycine betaine/proline transport system permease protein/glycine betaine/proline transport system substrate-binding protein
MKGECCMKKLSCALAWLLILTVFAGFATAGAENVVIVATDNGWDSQKLHNAIAELVVDTPTRVRF